MNTFGLAPTRVTVTTMESQTVQIIKSLHANPSSVTLQSAIRHPQNSSSIQSSMLLTVTKTTDNGILSRTDALSSSSSSLWLLQTMSHVESETVNILPSSTPSNVSGNNQVMLLYPPTDQTIKVTIKVSVMLNCTISGSNLIGVNMFWTYNKQWVMNNTTKSLNGHKVSYVLAKTPGVYECIVQLRNGDTQVAGIFEVAMAGKNTIIYIQ